MPRTNIKLKRGSDSQGQQMNIRKMSNGNMKKAAVVGAGVAATATAAYFLTGKRGRENRKKMMIWMNQMRGEISERAESLKEMSGPLYKKVVDEVTQKYADLRDVDKDELLEAISEIRRHWKNIAGRSTAGRSVQSRRSTKKISARNS